MTLGIGALGCRLDADVAVSSAGGVDWADLLAWNGNKRPVFAAKYLIGSPWRWVHGEASSLLDPAIPGAALKLVPVQSSDPVRQGEPDDLGHDWGSEDGAAIGAVIDHGIEVGEFDLVAGKPIPVYLEVAPGTALTADYWAGWSTAVRNVAFARLRPGAGLLVGQPLVPCIATAFLPSGNSWQLPPAIATALTPAPDQLWSNQCAGFWATTVDPATVTPTPTPAWPSFTPYAQPRPHGTPVPVPVRIWTYATGNPAAPTHQVGRLSLLTTQTTGPADPELDGMITLAPWSADAADPTGVGIDRGASVLDIIGCLQTSRGKLTVRHLPEATLGGAPGPALATPLTTNTSFVGRYYSQRNAAARRNAKDLTASEARKISGRHLDLVALFQAGIPYDSVGVYLGDPTHGIDDGKAAGWFAASKIKQPAHTPIYFAVDSDITTSGNSTRAGEHAITDDQLIAYFRGVRSGLDQALAAQPHPDRTPYAVGIYACRRAFDLLYAEGLASHFWQAFPPFWGSDAAGQSPNGVVWPHVNLWQVALSGNTAVQTQIGISRCKAGFTFAFLFTKVADPAMNPTTLSVRKGATTTTVTFQPDQPDTVSASDMQAVTGGVVQFGEVDATTSAYAIKLPTDPAPLMITPVEPYDHAAFRWEFRQEEGIADVNVAWGDPGGWQLAAP